MVRNVVHLVPEDPTMKNSLETIHLSAGTPPNMLYPQVSDLAFVVGKETLSPETCQQLRELILAHELAPPPSKNVLTWKGEAIDELRSLIRDGYLKFLRDTGIERRPMKIQCWANIHRLGDHIKLHQHNRIYRAVLSATIGLTDSDTETIYMLPSEMRITGPGTKTNVMRFPTRAGSFIMTPGWVTHMTTPNPGPGIRITLGMDISSETGDDDAITFDDLKEFS